MRPRLLPTLPNHFFYSRTAYFKVVNPIFLLPRPFSTTTHLLTHKPHRKPPIRSRFFFTLFPFPFFFYRSGGRTKLDPTTLALFTASYFVAGILVLTMLSLMVFGDLEEQMEEMERRRRSGVGGEEGGEGYGGKVARQIEGTGRAEDEVVWKEE